MTTDDERREAIELYNRWVDVVAANLKIERQLDAERYAREDALKARRRAALRQIYLFLGVLATCILIMAYLEGIS